MPTMSQRPLALILSVLLLHTSASLASPSFAGGNSFFLHTLPPTEQVSLQKNEIHAVSPLSLISHFTE